MATFDGTREVHIGAPGPWAQRRIAFHATSTYASAPAMDPLNEPIENGVAGGVGHHPNGQQQFHQNQQHANGGSAAIVKPRHSDPLSLPSSMPLQWTAPQKIGAGLSNLGNTCFLNSVLQCLTYTPPLAGYLQSGQHKVSCRVAGFCAFCALQEHVQQALASSGKVVSPQKLAKNLRCICRSFRMGRQEDSHEYMRYLLEALHKCCLPPDLAKNSNSKSSQEKSLVYKIFGGQLRSQVKCTACSHCSNTYDPFLDLSLEIVRADSLTKALARFTAVDVLDGDNKYKCPRCKKKVRAMKNFTIDIVPNILTIQFKRFSSTGGQGGKIDKKVEFGTTLDLKSFVSNGQDSVPRYKLFGVLVHSGWSTHSGHYYSFLRASSDVWHVFDDSRVRQVSEKTVLDQKAYMLFYVREGKRVTSSNSDPAPAPKQLVLPRQVALLSKERQTNADSGATTARQLPAHPPSTVSKENSERPPLAEVLPRKESSDSANVPHKDSGDANGELMRDISKQATLQTPVSFSAEKTPHAPVHAIEGNGSGLRVQPSPVNGSALTASATAPQPVLNNTGATELTAVPNPPAGEHFVHNVETVHQNDMEIDTCTTSGNLGFEDDWDEYYKKGWNPPGTTPQKFLQMLRVIPHTRRYYQARALPPKRASKIVSNGNGELENGHFEPQSEALTPGASGAKRPQAFHEDVRGPKRQYRELGRNCISSTCMASEEFFSASNEPVDITPSSNGNGPITLKENRLQSRIESQNANDSELRANFAANVVGGDVQRVAKRPIVVPIENGHQSGSNGHVDPVPDLKESLNKLREGQPTGGVEPRAGVDVENCRTSGSGDCGPQIKTSSLSPEKGTEVSNRTVLPTPTNSLYGTSVPRWGEVNGDEQSVKEIERLLEPEKNGSFEQDIWDAEYDRGRSKKVRNKAGKEQPTHFESNGIANGIIKPSNPFQSTGFAKKMGNNGIKKGNSIGFKAGYGYGLKTGKNVVSVPGPQVSM